MLDINITEPNLWKNENRVWAAFTLKNVWPDNNAVDPDTKDARIDAIPDIDSSRKALLKALELKENSIATARQIHSSNVAYVTSGNIYPDTDALVTTVTGLMLGIRVADCAAVLMSDIQSGVIGAAHAGWRGTVGGVLGNTVHIMERYGANPSRIKAYVSPCICQKCFEVGEEVARQFKDNTVNRSDFSKPHVNLKHAIRDRLLNLGLNPENLELDEGCTMHEPRRFYSYRREKERSGRMMGLIRLTE